MTLLQILYFVLEIWREYKKMQAEKPAELVIESRKAFKALREAKTVEEKNIARMRVNELINKL